MPYEVSMSGGSPWGFRLTGGVVNGTPVTVSRVTPGGKAAQANVMQGDVLVALNGTSISDMDLPEIMEQVKISGWTIHLTLLSQEEIEHSSQMKRKSESNFTSVTELERPRSQLAMTPCSERPSSKLRLRSVDKKIMGRKKKKSPPIPPDNHGNHRSSNNMPRIVIKVGGRANNSQPIVDDSSFHNGDEPISPVKAFSVDNVSERSASPQVAPKPKPRKTVQPQEVDIEQEEECTEQSSKPEKKVPDFIRRQIKPTKPLPQEFKPQVSWLHNKLRLKLKPGQALTDPGNSLKAAAAAYPCQPIEIEGPVSATIVHAQYNTPVGMYSANQIVNTLVTTAHAQGADVPEPQSIFGDQEVPVDTNTPVFKLVHKSERSTPTPAQSRSIQILDALLDYENGDLKI
uniref:PDZ and LIM domain protein 3 isoform X1 n=1 Tax=Ciona intestinalis TaxID=7719 RepID=UPI000180C759|nr:PDZ and LIM domain protein 3 isoform X1 [Ciona intestinalis]|eukprot:XP_026696662.1 PDZ and LIM domain protein 3 isoform X1 [Ciona intestinalis]